MHPDHLKYQYYTELQEACSLHHQLTTALPGLADRAADAALRGFLHSAMPPAHRNGPRLNDLLGRHGLNANHHADNCARIILREALDWAHGIDDPAVRDSALVASAQRILHHALSANGSLADSARQLDLEDRRVLSRVLDDTARANARLGEIAQDLDRRNPCGPISGHAATPTR